MIHKWARQLFFGNARCSRCHMVEGRGGRLGPDLSQIRNERKPSELRRAINNPDESLRDSFETFEVEFPDGQVRRGTARNNDTFSIQLMDERGEATPAAEEGSEASHAHSEVSDAPV